MRTKFLILMTLLLLSVADPVLQTTACAEETGLEYKVKAAFLLNFAKFTSWPTEKFSHQDFSFCILGKDPFGSALDGLEQKTIGGKSISLFHTQDMSQIGQCQLLYVSRSEQDRVVPIITSAADSSVLLVSDIEGFAAKGGSIEFITQDNRLGFKINLSQAETKGLKFNASLLSLAVKVL